MIASQGLSKSLQSFLRLWIQRSPSKTLTASQTPHIKTTTSRFYNYNPLSALLERQFFYQQPALASIPIRAQPYPRATAQMLFRNAAPKTFSTAARIHPPVTRIPPPSRMSRLSGGRKWVFPALALVALGTAIAADQFEQKQRHRQHEMALAEERRRKNEALMNAYGSKETLEDLEQALNYYEVQ